MKINIEDLEENPFNPRLFYDEDSIKQLAKSIDEHGLIHSILVRKKDSKYEIATGHRRFRAVKLLGWESVPVEVKKLTDEQMLDIALVENMERKDLTNVEISLVVKRYLGRGLTQEEIARKLGKSQTWISQVASLQILPETVRNDIIRRLIPESYGVEYVKYQKWFGSQTSKETAKRDVELLHLIVKEQRDVKSLAYLSQYYWGKPIESVRELQDHIEVVKWNILYSKYAVFNGIGSPTSLDKVIVKLYNLKREANPSKAIKDILFIIRTSKKWYPESWKEVVS